MKLIIFLALMLFSCNPEEPTIKYIPVEKTNLNPEEAQLVYLINHHRDSLGLSTLKVEVLTSQLAATHVSYMISVDSMTHYGFTQRYYDSQAKTFGEILAQGYISSESILAGYLGSPRHKIIIENPNYTWIGVSYEERFNCCLFSSY